MNKIEQYIDNIIKTPCFNVEKINSPSDEPCPSIEIVIPVFNGYDALVSCLNSVIKYTSDHHQITLLNDASTDSNVKPFLEDFVAQHDHAKLINREKNLGYLQNVNQHLVPVKSDVILLNADTEVKPNWIEELSLVNKNPRIGIVCPVSDNATLLTLSPKALKAEKHLSHLSGHWFPIPTAVGSCMLIKKHIITQLGGFDPFYDPGYGEECDYSMLVRQLGYQIACAPASLVKHQGSQSFVQHAEHLKQQHQKLLDLRWPSYQTEIKNHYARNPILWVEQKIKSLSTQKKRVLHVVHGIDNKGGVELFTRELLAKFGDEFEHTLLIPKRSNKAKTKNKIDCEIIEIDKRYLPSNSIIFNLPADVNNFELDTYFSNLLKAAGFNLVHFHSLVGMGSDIWPLLCRKLNIPYLISLHDHKGLCPIFSLSTRTDNQEVYCGKSKSNAEDKGCITCIEQKTQKTNLTTRSYIQTHNQIWIESLTHANQLIFASQYLLEKYLESYPEIVHQSKVQEPSFYSSQKSNVKPINKNRVQVAFLGQFGILKGAQLFIDLNHKLNADPIDFHIIGGVDPAYKNQLKKTTIKRHGSYDRAQLSGLLESIDLIILTSQIPETYGLTLTEAWLHGVPVVAPDVGAYLSRVKVGVNGFLYKNNQIESLAKTINKFIKHQSSKSAIKQIEYIADHCFSTKALERTYASLTIKSISSFQVQDPDWLSINAPKISAYKNMQQWLDAPMTLEAEGDWLEHEQPVLVMILGDQSDLIATTMENIKSQLSRPIFINVETLKTTANFNSNVILLIDAGNEINENIGNWVHAFLTTEDSIGTSDYALFNHNKDVYAPHFNHRFSWHNHCLNNQSTGSILINLDRFNIDELLVHLKSNIPIKKLTQYGYNKQQLTHFPYFSHLIFDQNWVKNWKKSKTTLTHKPKRKKIKACLILESNLKGEVIIQVVKYIRKQSLFKSHDVHLYCNNTPQLRATISEQLNKQYDVVLLFRDNIFFKKDTSLKKAIDSFVQSDFDAVTIPAAREQTNTYIIGKKLGAAQHVQGIGAIHNQAFDNIGDFIECDLIDDDFLMIKPAVFPLLIKHCYGLGSYFQSLKISVALRSKLKTIGMYKPSLIFKKGAPTQPSTMPTEDLKKQRMALYEQKLHLFDETIYSHAYSNRNNCQLETNLCQFKTPKNLPRVVAFAPDEWASDFYRVKSPLAALAAQNHASVIFMTPKKNFIPTPYEIHQLDADVMLLHGFYNDKQLSALNQYRKQLPIKIIISIDDLLTEIPDYNALSKNVPKDVSKRIKLACSLADTLLVTTPQLASDLSFLHPNIKVIPNRLSKTIWQFSTTHKSNKKIRVGWAGAGQHSADLAWLKTLVKQTQAEVQWVFFGDKPQGLSDDLFEFHSPVEFNQYAHKLASLNLDIGIAPLVKNNFNSAKSNLKLIELATLSIPVLASKIQPYKNSPAILLPNDVKQWKTAIIDLSTDKNKRLALGLKMNNWMNKNYWLEDHLDEWSALLRL